MAVLFLVALVGALGQAGLLAPKIALGPSAGNYGTFSWTSRKNVSWRSWVISDPHVVSVTSPGPGLRDRQVRVMLEASSPSPPPFVPFHPGSSRSLDVAAGKTFYLGASVPGSACGRHPASLWVLVGVDIATPLGTRTASAALQPCG